MIVQWKAVGISWGRAINRPETTYNVSFLLKKVPISLPHALAHNLKLAKEASNMGFNKSLGELDNTDYQRLLIEVEWQDWFKHNPAAVEERISRVVPT